MNKMKKALALLLCAVILVAGSVVGTVAYLTYQDTVVNTFTVGNVEIKLDEAPVDKVTGLVVAGERTDKNEYHLLPGHTYVKDPMVTVLKNSEECYVRMQVAVKDMSAMKQAFPEQTFPEFYKDGLFLLQKLVNGWTAADWACVSYTDNADGSGTYEFWYKDKVAKSASDTALPALFQSITIPGKINNVQLARLQDAEITIVAHAIQADGFADAAAAWAAWTN